MEKMTLKEYFTKHFFNLLGDTMYYVVVAAIVGLIFGLLLGILLFFLKRSKGKIGKVSYNILDFLINILRSFPVYILIFAIVPLTRVIMGGNAFGSNSFIVPLSVAAIPFFAKLIENALNEVEPQMIEAGQSLGLSWGQIIRKVVIREAMPSIISGVTLGIVTLFGYSALAGAVGGSGFGAFAYTYGYQTYDVNAMIYAVLSIILIVELISLLGNFLYRRLKFGGKLKTNDKIVGVTLITCFGILIVLSIISIIPKRSKEIKVGTMVQPGLPIIESVQEEFYQKTGYKLKVVIYSDFITPNKALQEGSLDVNLFQHEPFLINYNKANNASLKNAATLYDCVYGAYTKKSRIKSVNDLKTTDIIAIADDSSNLKRCLLMLEAEGVLTLNHKAMEGELSGEKLDDYIANYIIPCKIEALPTAAIAKKLEDKDCALGLVNATFAIAANLTSNELIFQEKDPEHVNANILACRSEDLDADWLKVLVDLLTSEKISDFINDTFKGTIIPYFVNHLA